MGSNPLNLALFNLCHYFTVFYFIVAPAVLGTHFQLNIKFCRYCCYINFNTHNNYIVHSYISCKQLTS